MAEIVPVTSEALEAQIRDLLPSQRGFGEDLQASNVITPIIDLTAAAQGTTTPEYLQTALSFDSQTAYSVANATSALANTPGFYRIFGVCSVRANGQCSFVMSDGLSNKTIWSMTADGGGDYAVEHDFTVFLQSGESISATSTTADAIMAGSTRQVATVTGTLVNPAGFTPQ